MSGIPKAMTTCSSKAEPLTDAEFQDRPDGYVRLDFAKGHYVARKKDDEEVRHFAFLRQAILWLEGSGCQKIEVLQS